MLNKDLFKEVKAISTLAWPLLIAQVTQTLMGVADTIMAGRYSALDMAAVAIGVSISLPILIFIQGICLALSPIVSRLHGERKTPLVARQVQQMLYISIAISVCSMSIIFFLPNVIGLVEMEADLAQKSQEYLVYVVFSFPAFAIYQTLRNCCEGLSLTRPTMIIMVVGLLVNVPANYIFINGLFGVPEMGGVGCGLATMLVFYVMALATAIFVRYSSSIKHLKVFGNWAKPSLSDMKTQLSLGVPIAFTLLFEVTLFSLVAFLLAPFGANTVAAHQITINVSSLIFMLPLSIALAAAIRVGFLLGEKNVVQAKLAYKAALSVALSLVLFTASSLVLFNNEIASLYTHDISVIEVAASLMLLAALFQFSDSIQVVSAHTLRGYKDTIAMFYISLFAYWMVGFPLGVLLGLTDWLVPKMAAKGFWIGFIVGLSVAAILMYSRLKYIQHRLAEKEIT